MRWAKAEASERKQRLDFAAAEIICYDRMEKQVDSGAISRSSAFFIAETVRKKGVYKGENSPSNVPKSCANSFSAASLSNRSPTRPDTRPNFALAGSWGVGCVTLTLNADYTKPTHHVRLRSNPRTSPGRRAREHDDG